MPAYSDEVGLRFREMMSGKVTPQVEGSLVRQDFAFDLNVEIKRLRQYIEGASHLAQLISGRVTWEQAGHPAYFHVDSGTITMFRKEPGAPRNKYFDIDFAFQGPHERRLLFHGEKHLHDDGHMDVFDAAGDLSKLALVRITDAETGEVVATGQTSVHFGEILAQLGSMEVLLASNDREQEEARKAFFAFMNRELAEVYSDLPFIFTESSILSWAEQMAVMLAADVMLPAERSIPPREVVHGIEQFLSNANSPLINRIRPALAAFGALEGIARLNREHLRREVEEKLRGDRTLWRDALDLIHSMVVIPYYAHRSVDEQLGYKRYPITSDLRPPAPLLPIQNAPSGDYDFLIAGSGPAGCLLAERLTAAGKRVLLLEAGQYHPESMLTNDEIHSISRLYKEGGLQRAHDPGAPHATKERTFPVLQGECLGGGAVVNNAVCFRLPPEVEKHWRDDCGFPFGPAELTSAYEAVAKDLHIVKVSEALRPEALANPAYRFLDALGDGLQECEVNIEKYQGGGAHTGCMGCGYCNLGCAFERKRNALQVYLPRAVQTDRLHIITRARVQGLVMQGNHKISHALVRIGAERQPQQIRAKHYILSCGPIGSSMVLHNTKGLDKDVRKLVGRHLSANIGSPVHAFLTQPVDSTRALQIAHYYRPLSTPAGFVIETWFNPPATQALAMPGFLDTHSQRMLQFRNIVAAAPLVGMSASGTISPDGRIELPIPESDLRKLHAGISTLARAFLKSQNTNRVKSVLVSTRLGLPLTSEADVNAFENSFSDLRELQVGTGHPQGGNAISIDSQLGVVDSTFRVRGVDNLFVCDGSLFPDSARVNPQWTIMALAHLCGERLAQLT